MNKKIKVLVVDDSAFMRQSISFLLREVPEIEVIGTARDGKDAVEKVKALKPDVVTLDVEMPVMTGLEALEIIMKESPTSVIMFSSLTSEGADATIKALELGAVDFLAKDNTTTHSTLQKIKNELIDKIKHFANKESITSRLSRLRRKPDFSRPQEQEPVISSGDGEKKILEKRFEAIAIGISTGGPLTLNKVIPFLPAEMKLPVFIVQHMPPNFTASLARRLDAASKVEVKEAEDGEEIRGGVVYIAKGGVHMNFVRRATGKYYIKLNPEPAKSLHKPSVDEMISSAVDAYRTDVLGVIMTGMGKDGLLGIRKLKSKGGYAVAQNKESCVVYGMPKAIVDERLADVIAPIEKITEIISKVGTR
jgi:two-component system chemotaxis response regulator CheB